MWIKFDKITVYKAFTDDLKTLSFKQIMPLFPVAFDPNFNFYGYVVRIDYQDGEHDIVCYAMRTVRSATGKVTHKIGTCTEKKFIEILEKYIILKDITKSVSK